jgi:hypothetical protein
MHEVTTNEIMEFLQEHMLTKEDGEKLMTKEEGMTKKDGESFMTKDDGDRLLARLIALETRQNDFATKKDLEEMKEEIMGVLDYLVKKQDNFGTEMAAMHSKYDRIERRLSAVEKKVGLSARA